MNLYAINSDNAKTIELGASRHGKLEDHTLDFLTADEHADAKRLLTMPPNFSCMQLTPTRPTQHQGSRSVPEQMSAILKNLKLLICIMLFIGVKPLSG